VERLLLLWDELDELMGYGRHLVVGLKQAVFPKAAPKPLN
jgi:hypothetical protein